MASPCRSFTCAMKALTLAFAMRCADGFQRGASDMTRQILIARGERIEDLVGVLAHAWQRSPHTRTASAEEQGQQHDLRARAVVGRHRHEAAARFQMRIVDELLGTYDRRIGQARGIELRW